MNLKCRTCGEAADVVQTNLDTRRIRRAIYYYCFVCLARAGDSDRPYGWDGIRQRPRDDEGEWKCEYLDTPRPTLIGDHIERERRSNQP